MDTWRSEFMDMLEDMSQDDIEAACYLIAMVERDYEDHLQKKEKKNES